MELTKIYRWDIPTELHEQFRRDWERITGGVASSMGQLSASLFQLNSGDFISVTRWPDHSTYEKWVSWIMQSNEGKTYYLYEKERHESLVSFP